MPVSYSMTSCESSLMMIRCMLSEMASKRSSINTLYLAILFFDHLIHIPLKLTNSSLGVKMAHAAEDKFCVL